MCARVKRQVREPDVHCLPCTMACFWKEIPNKVRERRNVLIFEDHEHGRYIWGFKK